MDLTTLLTQPDPIQWSLDNLEMIGRGSNAYVFAHPEQDDVAIRLCEDADDWFAYAMEIREAPSSHGPVVHALGHGNGAYAALMERLSPLDAEWERRIEAFVHQADNSQLPPSMLEFMASLSRRPTDLRADNWMLRDSTLVLVDPFGSMMSPDEVAWFEQENAVAANQGAHP